MIEHLKISNGSVGISSENFDTFIFKIDNPSEYKIKTMHLSYENYHKVLEGFKKFREQVPLKEEDVTKEIELKIDLKEQGYVLLEKKIYDDEDYRNYAQYDDEHYSEEEAKKEAELLKKGSIIDAGFNTSSFVLELYNDEINLKTENECESIFMYVDELDFLIGKMEKIIPQSITFIKNRQKFIES